MERRRPDGRWNGRRDCLSGAAGVFDNHGSATLYAAESNQSGQDRE